MRGIAGDQSQLTISAGSERRKICRLNYFSSNHNVMELFSAPENVHIIAIFKSMDVPEERIAMPRNYRVPHGSWNCRARHVPRAEQQRMTRGSLDDYRSQTDARDRKLSESVAGCLLRLPFVQELPLFKKHPGVASAHVGA